VEEGEGEKVLVFLLLDLFSFFPPFFPPFVFHRNSISRFSTQHCVLSQMF